MISYKCQYCGEETKPEIDSTGEIPVGLLVLCDCPESRKAWELHHRAEMEKRKNASRGTHIRSRSIVHVGRTPMPTGKLRYRSR